MSKRKKSKGGLQKSQVSDQVQSDGYDDSQTVDLAAQMLQEFDEDPVPEKTPSLSYVPPNESWQPKRNRRKEKLAQRKQERDDLVESHRRETEFLPKTREDELLALDAQFAAHHLTVYDITPDGHCLFASLSDQLKERADIKVDALALRAQAARYIREHPGDFAPFLLDEETGELRDVKEYCHTLETTGLWGGDMEIAAIARLYEVPVRVFIARGSPYEVNTESSGATLNIAYYKEIYGLGAHYNSLRDELVEP